MTVVVLFFGLKLSFAETAPVDDSYSARVWQAEDGLPENRVVGIAQTVDGFLWVATQGGVARFDGVRFQSFDSDMYGGWLSGLMQGLLRDRSGRLWLTKELGVLICIEGTNITTYTPTNGLPEAQAARDLGEDGEGNIWVSYSKGAVVRLKEGRVEDFTDAKGLNPSGVCWLAKDSVGQLWFARGGQVGVFRNEHFVGLLDTGSGDTRIAPAKEGGIWIATPQQISRFSESEGLLKRADFIPNVTGNAPTAVIEDRDGVVWVGTESAGLFRCDVDGVARVETSHLSILCLMDDLEGNLWVGTRGGGLDRVHRRLISMATLANGLPFAGVQSVCQDASGALWAVGNNGVLAHQEGNAWVVKPTRANGAKLYCTCVEVDANDTVWVGTRGGTLLHSDGGGFEALGVRDDFNQRSLRGLLATARGDLWIASDAPDTLYRLRNGQLKAFELRSGFRFIRTLAEDAAGNVWAGATDGLLVRVTEETLVDVTPQPDALSIRCLYGATNGDLWIGYAGGGVGQLRQGKLNQFSLDQGLPNSYVSQIQEDGKGNLWFAGNQGIFQVRAQDFEEVSNGRSSAVQPFIYGRSEGLQGIQASFDFCPASVRSKDQRLFFSMLTGLAEVRLDYARSNRLPPPVYIERVTADGRIYAAYRDGSLSAETNQVRIMDLASKANRAELRLPPGLQNVRFDFTALSFSAPENNRFRYKLEGLDERWVDADNRRVAEYTHPLPGDYRFRVIACNNDGVWNEKGASLTVRFEPYFWETVWFKAMIPPMVMLGVCGPLVWVLRSRHRRQLQRIEEEHLIERERSRIARDLHDDLGVRLTEIGLLGDLAGSPSATLQTNREYLHEITGCVRGMAEMLDEIVWALNPVNDTSQSVTDYFSRYAQKLLERASIRCRLEFAEPQARNGLNAEQKHQLFLAFKEALNNVIQHSGASEVRISLGASNGHWRICVADDGRGFEGCTGQGSPDGLKNMHERLSRLGGRCDISSRHGGGTCVTLLIPAKEL